MKNKRIKMLVVVLCSVFLTGEVLAPWNSLPGYAASSDTMLMTDAVECDEAGIEAEGIKDGYDDITGEELSDSEAVIAVEPEESVQESFERDSEINVGDGSDPDNELETVTWDKEKKLTEDTTVNGNLILNMGYIHNIDLNGFTLHVTGNVKHLSGGVDINKGKFQIDGDYIAQSDELNPDAPSGQDYAAGYLVMENEEDRMIVGGDIVAQSQSNYSSYAKLNAGILEVKGNVTDYTGWMFNPYINSTHVTVFNGNDTQVVDMMCSDSDKGYFNVIRTENPKVQFKKIAFVKLDQDATMTGDVEDIKLAFDLKGHTLTINGNVTQTSNKVVLSLNGGKLQITGDFRHLAGGVSLDKGTLEIEGNYIAQSEVLDPDTVSGRANASSYLIFENDEDKVIVGGDIVAQSQSSYSVFAKLNAGVLEVKGNVTDYTGWMFNPYSTSTHVTVFNGTGTQVIDLVSNASDRGHFNVIRTENPKVQFKKIAFNKLDQDAIMTGDVEDISHSFDLQGHTLTINGNVTQKSSTEVLINMGGMLHITGDYRHLSGDVNFGRGTLQVDGNYIAQSEELDTNTISGKKNASSYLKFVNDEDRMIVGGNIIAQSTSPSGKFDAGVLEAKGDVTDYTGCTIKAMKGGNSTHKTILNGTTHQSIKFYQKDKMFNELKITQPLKNYTFDPNPCWLSPAKLVPSDEEEEEVVSVPATGISLAESEYTLRVGDTGILNAVITPANADKDVSWTVSSDVADIIPYGKSIWTADSGDIIWEFVPAKPGKATVTVTTKGGAFSASCEVTVLDMDSAVPGKVHTVTFWDGQEQIGETTITEGELLTGFPELTARSERFLGWYDRKTGKYVDDNTVVKSDMRLTARFAGVSGMNARLIITADNDIYMVKGQTYTLPSVSTEGSAISWTSSDPKVVKINKNTVKAVKPTDEFVQNHSNSSRVMIYNGTSPDSSEKAYTVHILDAAIYFNRSGSMIKSGKTDAILPGESVQLALGNTVDATTAKLLKQYDITWISANPEVANVDETGLVTAGTVGTAKVTGYIGGKAFNVTVKVVPTRNVASLGDLTETSVTMNPLQTATLKYTDGFKINKARVTDSGNTLYKKKKKNGTVEFYQNGVIRLTPAGKVTAVGPGTTTLYFDDGKIQKNVTITVAAPLRNEVYVNTKGTKNLKYYNVKPAKALSWTASDSALVSGISNGKLKAGSGKTGRALITCVYDPYAVNGAPDTGFVFTTIANIEDIKFATDTNLSCANDTNYQLNMSLKDSSVYILKPTGIERPANYVSGKPSIAFVDETGAFIANSKGSSKNTVNVNGRKINIQSNVID